jgi:hypothetical protein
VLTVAAVIGLVVYRVRPRIEKKSLRFGVPKRLAGEGEASFPASFALLLATVAETFFDENESAFLDDTLISLLAVDRRLVL